MSEFRIERGDIFYIDRAGPTFGCEQRSGRPGVIVSSEENNKHSQTVEIVYCTTKEKPSLPTHTVILGTPYESTVLCEQVTTVSVDRLGNYIGKCTEQEMREIDLCIMVSLGLATPDMKKIYAETNRAKKEDRKVEAGVGSERVEDKELIAIRVERDTYKRMYEVVVDKLATVAVGAMSGPMDVRPRQ